jgi:hypothetical protein
VGLLAVTNLKIGLLCGCCIARWPVKKKAMWLKRTLELKEFLLIQKRIITFLLPCLKNEFEQAGIDRYLKLSLADNLTDVLLILKIILFILPNINHSTYWCI